MLPRRLRNDAKPAMVCSADDLLEWKDFPKGLRVLLLDEDSVSASEIKSKLEEMDYIVSVFCNEIEALEAISNKGDSFHVAIVEVSTGNSQGCFRFLETARDLPTIMISSIHCLSTMMKCIALGAAEFLQKPLSEDKLRNIWQHVVHKAFNAGGTVPKSLKPVKETVVSMLQLKSETAGAENQNLSEAENSALAHEHGHEESLVTDRYPAPSTPQLERGRSSDIGCCQDQPNCSMEKESKEHDGESIEFKKFSCSESKSVENTCINTAGAVTVKAESPSGEPIMEEEVDSADGSKTDECNATKESIMSSHSRNGDNIESGTEDVIQKKASTLPNLCGNRTNRKKMKVDWTPELHRRFVQAVEQLGIDQAIPSKILELMKVEGLTRHNVASHLQKYRMHRRHIMPKEDERKWQQQRDPNQRSYMHKPIVAFPPYNSNCGLPTNQIYPVWGHPSCPPPAMQMWGHPSFPMWQTTESWRWRTYHGVLSLGRSNPGQRMEYAPKFSSTMHGDAWGCPVVQPQGSFWPKNTAGFEGGYEACRNSFDLLHPAEEVIDKVVKEVISQPWLPLPLGLKPPSTESVVTELHRQGIRSIPPSSS